MTTNDTGSPADGSTSPPAGPPTGPPIRPPTADGSANASDRPIAPPTPPTAGADSSDPTPTPTPTRAPTSAARRGASVRLRITLAVAAVTACAVVLIAVVAPGRVESTLEDDLLEARAIAAADALEFDLGAVVVGDDVFTTDEFTLDDLPFDVDALPGFDDFDLGELIEVFDQLPDDLIPNDLFPADVAIPGDLLPSDISFEDLFPADLLPDDISLDDIVPGDLFDLTLGDVGVNVAGETLLDSIDSQVELATESGAIDALLDAADGEFAIAADTNGYVIVTRDDDGDVGTEAPQDGDPRDLDVPVMVVSDFDSYLFDDLAFLEISDGAFVDSSTESSRTVVGVQQVDGVDFLVSDDAGAVDRTVDTVRRLLWLAAPALVLLIGGVAWLLTGRALRPVRSITEQAATISGGTLDTRVPVPATGDEIATLATTVNGMLDRLETDDRRRRQFVSDASHELRTPVAVLRSEAEVALRHPESTRVDELADSVAAESARMSVVIDDLLALARQDEGIRRALVDVDLDDLLLADAARSRRVPVTTPGVSAARVHGDPGELARMIGHLLDNAARHAETSVVVTLSTAGGTARLIVDDDGPGVPPDRREQIFERFARLDDARTRDRGGAGLGLAVVRGIAERHGGSVGVDRAPLGGARFVVTLPAA
ncbi:MAG: ATP-binding protein [Actinomycetota bacterium]